MQSDEINQKVIILLVVVSSCFMALILGIIYFSEKSRKVLINTNEKLHMSNERFRVAVANTSNDVIEYDIKKNKLFSILDISPNEDYDEQIDQAAEKFYYEEMITPEYKEVFQNVLRRLREGDYTASCIVKLEQADGSVYWNQIIFTNIYLEIKKPIRAIGTIEDITVQKEAEFRFAQEEQHRQAMLSEVITTYVFNLTKNRYTYGYDSNNTPININLQAEYNEELKRLMSINVHPDDHEKVVRELCSEHLTDAYKLGNHKLEVEYRRFLNGKEQWVSCSTNLLISPDTKDLLGYSYLEDITQEKVNEMALRYDAERDLLTSLFNRHTANRMITEFLDVQQTEYEMKFHAFYIIDLDKFKAVNDTYGHIIGDELLIEMARRLTFMFRKTDIVGRFGGDEFIVFLKNSRTREHIEDKASEICKSLKEIRISADPEYRISGSVGISIAPEDGGTVEDLYRKADIALYAAKKAGRDQYKIYSSKMEEDGKRIFRMN